MNDLTHLQQFECLLADANIGAIKRISADDSGTTIELRNTGQYGYAGFFSAWEFDADGRLTSIEHWE